MNNIGLMCVAVLLVGMPFATCAGVNPGKKADDFDKYKTLDARALDEYGWQTNASGWVIRVDRNRVFERFHLTCPVSTEKWPSGVVLDEGVKDEGMFPFEGARVRSLEIDGWKVSAALTRQKAQFETLSLKGIQELSQIVIHGPIPRFQENTKWMGLKKDDDWRKSLKRVEFVDHVENMDSIAFLSEVKCIAVGTNTLNGVKKWRSTSLRKCYGLEKLEVPYSMATNTAINWGVIIRGSPLKDREVLSFEPVPGDGSDHGNVVLLNLASSGEISDCVTEIRSDAIPDNFGRPVYLPFCGKRIIGGHISERVLLALKKNAVLFYPDISAYDVRTKLSDRRSVVPTCSVSVTTAYNGLLLSNSVSNVSAEFTKSDGSGYAAYRGAVLLRQCKGLENKVSAKIKIGQDVYRVKMMSSNGQLEDEYCITFLRDTGSVWNVICLGLVIFLIFSVLWCLTLVRSLKTGRFQLKRCVGATVGVVIGVLVFILGMDNVGVLQCFVDKNLTGEAMSYLNSSFISSLLISVSVTAVKLAVGFVQGFNFSFIAGYDLNSVLQPVQEVLDKISTYSWISTCVLGFMRIFCQVLKDCAWMIWGVLGGSIILYSFMVMLGWFRGRHLVITVITVASFLSFGMPLLLFGCSWFSGQLSCMACDAINRAVLDCKAFADSLTFDSMFSIESIKELVSEFTNAISNLASAAMYYVATKAFDCFIVPLLIYFGIKKVFRGFCDRKDVELSRIREILDKSGSDAHPLRGIESAPVTDVQQAHCESKVATVLSRDIPTALSKGDIRGSILAKLACFAQRVKPEWVTACCAMAICVIVALGSLSSRPEVVISHTSGGASVVLPSGEGCAQSGSCYVNEGCAGQFIFGIIALLLFCLLDYYCYRKALQVCKDTREDPVVTRASGKLALLNERSYWFDLPLYGGLGGTVLGFLIISIPAWRWLESGGRIVAYLSTLLGIFVTWWIQKKIISPYKTDLMRQKVEEESAHE